MSAAQLFILEKLDEKEPASVSELAERTCTHQTSISGVVARLLKADLVSKTTSPEDARRVELRMTPAGKMALRSSAGSVQAEMLDALNQMSLAKRERLARLLNEWVRLAGLAEGTAAMFMEDTPAASAPATRRRRKM